MTNNTVYLCLIIFFVRIVETGLSTIQTMMVVRNKTILAFVVSFLQVLVWFLIVREALSSTDYIMLIAIAYSLGYATGVMVGMYITETFLTSNVTVNIVVKQKKQIVEELINHDYAVSVTKIKGKDLISNKYMILVCTTNKRVKLLKDIVTDIDDHAFIVVSENKMTIGGY